MAKIGDGVPRLIDKAVDFMVSSQAFMEYLKSPASAACTAGHSLRTRKRCSCSRLEYYRQLYRPVCDQTEPESER